MMDHDRPSKNRWKSHVQNHLMEIHLVGNPYRYESMYDAGTQKIYVQTMMYDVLLEQ